MDDLVESILDYMSRFYHATGDEDISDLFSDLVDGVKSVNKSYEVFIITDSKNLSKDYSIIVAATNDKEVNKGIGEYCILNNKLNLQFFDYIHVKS